MGRPPPPWSGRALEWTSCAAWWCAPSPPTRWPPQWPAPPRPGWDYPTICPPIVDVAPEGGQLSRGLLLQEARRPYVLLIGADSLSQLIDFKDRSTCTIFGDGAGAAVLTLEEGRLYDGIQGARGCDTITIGGDRDKRPLIHMDGQAVFRFAVESFTRAAHALTQRNGLSLDDIDWFIPHQANRRIVEAAAKHLKQPADKFYVNIDHYANTSAASIPMAMDEMQEKGLLKRGQKILCAAFGSGLTWGGTLLEF